MANTITHATLTPTASDSNATIQVGKGSTLEAVTSGQASNAIALSVGANAITVKVTAQDSSTKDYTVTITRQSTGGDTPIVIVPPPVVDGTAAQSSDATLSGITLSAGGESVALTETFAAGRLAYTASVTHLTDVLTVSADAAHDAATVAITPEDADANSAGHQVSLSVGENVITITVTAEDETNQTYTVTVTRAAAPVRVPPPPVTNLTVCNGPGAGEVVVSWDAVSQATHYRIGYVNMVQDYPRAKGSVTGEWIEAFNYVDVDAQNVAVSGGRAQYVLRRLVPGERHAITVLTADRVVNSRETLSGAYVWPQNPRWRFLTVGAPTAGCVALARPAAGTAEPAAATQPPADAPALPPPAANLSVCSGANAGEVVVSWDAVSQATHYRIGYVNMAQDYPLAKSSATGEWIEAFVFVEVNARNVPVSEGRADYTLRRLARGERHAITVLTADNVVNNRETFRGAWAWPQNPRWRFLTVADPASACRR